MVSIVEKNSGNKERDALLNWGAKYAALAHMLMDAADSCLMFSIEKLDKVNCMLDYEHRIELERAKHAAKIARQEIKQATNSLYDCDEADCLIEETDWLLKCIVELTSRCNGNVYAMEDMYEYICRKKNTLKVVEGKK